MEYANSSVENVCPHPTHPHHDDEDEEHAHNNHSHFHTPERRASMSPMLPKEQEECSSHATAHGMSATLGLVIHGLADGIALGASSLSDNKQLGLVVFLAVLVHKGECASRQSLQARGRDGRAGCVEVAVGLRYQGRRCLENAVAEAPRYPLAADQNH